MPIRIVEPQDLARIADPAVETFGPFYEGSFRPLVGEVIFTRQHGRWREDYRTLLATLHAPEHHRYAAIAEVDGVAAGFVGWEIDPSSEHARIEIFTAGTPASALAVIDGQHVLQSPAATGSSS